MLTSKLRSRVLFQRIVNKIIVINIIRKKTSRKIVREEIVRKLRELAPEVFMYVQPIGTTIIS